MTLDRILVTVKTYPTLSSKYGELVCTAGVREDGSWVRIYPIPFRRMNQQFKKYTWIELELEKRSEDHRPESYRPLDCHDIRVYDFVSTENQWQARREYILARSKVYYNLDTLVAMAKRNELSIAVFKPTEILNFKAQPEPEKNWDQKKLSKALSVFKQGDLFNPKDYLQVFHAVPKLPYKFSYVFKDDSGRQSTMMIEDWEVGQLFWNCLKRQGSENSAIASVRAKYFDNFAKNKDLHFFLGTTKRFHNVAPNPFVIIGTFYPPPTKQMEFKF